MQKKNKKVISSDFHVAHHPVVLLEHDDLKLFSGV